jgi:RHH-type transcriptional regulator, rel operon repressor / antitoxin RelB
MTDTVANVVTLTVELPRELYDRLSALAQESDQSALSLLTEAVHTYVEAEEEDLRDLDEAIARADAGGPFIEHAVVAAWLDSWGTENELPPPA